MRNGRRRPGRSGGNCHDTFAERRQQVVVAREIHEFSSTSIQMGAAAGIFLWHHYLFVPDIMEKRVLRIDRNTGIWLMWDGKVPVRASFDVPEPSVS
jgi:hypothetical protein